VAFLAAVVEERSWHPVALAVESLAIARARHRSRACLRRVDKATRVATATALGRVEELTVGNA
jgi:hypothetical protein